MPSPFPGMDPWLESPDEWPGFHDTLVIKTVEVLQPQLRARGYYAKPGEREWLSHADRAVGPDVVTARRAAPADLRQASSIAVALPDEPIRIAQAEFEIHEGYVDIYEALRHEIVTGIEFLSPTNKSDRKGRRLYRIKQRDLRKTQVHLVEIDLLRAGRFVLDVPRPVVERLQPWDYLVNLVRRGGPDYEVYPISLPERMPRIRVPLKSGDEDAVLDLQEVFKRSYDIGPYPERLDYQSDPNPPLSAEHADWANRILRGAGLRH